MKPRLIAPVAVLATLAIATHAAAERAPEDRSKATHVVVGNVEGVYLREEGDTRHYVVEIAVEKVEKGDKVKTGDTIYVRCYLWTPDFYKGKKLSEAEEKKLLFRGGAYDGLPKEGERVRVFVKFHGGKYDGIYPSWYEILKEK